MLTSALGPRCINIGILLHRRSPQRQPTTATGWRVRGSLPFSRGHLPMPIQWAGCRSLRAGRPVGERIVRVRQVRVRSQSSIAARACGLFSFIWPYTL